MNLWIKSTLLAAGIAATGGVFAQGSYYDRYNDDYYERYDTNRYSNEDRRYSHWDYEEDAYARVVAVNPIVVDSRRPVTRQVCRVSRGQSYNNGGWGDGYYYDGRYRYDSRSNTPAILGAVIGGLLGNQVGDGSGQVAATVAGAAIGAAVGSNQGRNRDGYRDDRYGDRDDDYGDNYYGEQRYYGNGHYDGRNYNGRRYAGRWSPHVVEQCRTVTRNRGDARVVAYDVTYEYNNRLYQTQTNYRPGRQIRVRLDS